MFRLATGIAFTLPILLGTAYSAAWSVQQPNRPSWPRTLAIFACMIVALLSIAPPFYFYKGALCLAILILIVGDGLMLIPGSPPTLRGGVNVVVYFLMWLAFSITAGRQLWTLPGLWGLLPLAVGALLYVFVFYPRLEEMRLTVGLYMLNAAFVVASAVALFAIKPGPWSFVGMLGAIVFVSADVIAAFHAWWKPFRWMPLYWTLCLLLGLLILAWSNWTEALEWLAAGIPMLN